jgi:hypothetical protein
MLKILFKIRKQLSFPLKTVRSSTGMSLHPLKSKTKKNEEPTPLGVLSFLAIFENVITTKKLHEQIRSNKGILETQTLFLNTNLEAIKSTTTQLLKKLEECSFFLTFNLKLSNNKGQINEKLLQNLLNLTYQI